MHLDSLKHPPGRNRRHTQRHLSKPTLSPSFSLQNLLYSHGFSLPGKQWIHTNTNWKTKTKTKTKSKAGANLEASRSLGQAGCDPQGWHPKGSLRGTACFLDHHGFSSASFLNGDAWVFISFQWAYKSLCITIRASQKVSPSQMNLTRPEKTATHAQVGAAMMHFLNPGSE